MDMQMKKMIEPYLEKHINENYYDEPEYIELMNNSALIMPKLFLFGLDFNNDEDVAGKINWTETGLYWVIENGEYIQYLIILNGKCLESLVFHNRGTVEVNEYNSDGILCGNQSGFFKDFSKKVNLKCPNKKLEALKDFLKLNEIEFKVE